MRVPFGAAGRGRPRRPWPDVDQRLEVRGSSDVFVLVGDVDYPVPPRFTRRRLAVRASLARIRGVLGRQLDTEEGVGVLDRLRHRARKPCCANRVTLLGLLASYAKPRLQPPRAHFRHVTAAEPGLLDRLAPAEMSSRPASVLASGLLQAGPSR
jgi:hypothetical protein